MTMLRATVMGFAPLILAAAIITGLLAIYHATTEDQFIAACLAAVALVVAALVAPAFIPHHDTDGDAETHMEPLRLAGTAEKTLETDLRQRRMLLPGKRPPRGRHAAPVKPASIPAVPVADAATVTLPVIPARDGAA